VSSLLHEYDAAKRRDYYLRTRQLTGRNKKSVPSAVAKRPTAHIPVKKTHAQRQKELEARVQRLQGKLKRLQAALKILVEAAQKRSGVSKNTSEKAAISNHQNKTSDPTSKYQKKTQKQKDAAAVAAQKYRDKNKVLEDQVTDLNNKIKAIRDRIKRIQKTGSVGASKSNTR